MQALILVGGLGTRLRSLVNDRPKPMALVGEKPFLEYVIRNLKRNGIEDIVLATGYMGNFIENYFKDGRRFGVKISYSHEKEQLGTAGAIKNAEKFLKDELFVLNGDTYFNVNFEDIYKFHLKNNSYFTMALREVKNASRYGAVECDSTNKIQNFIEKGVLSESNCINGGIYIIRKEILKLVDYSKKVSLEKDIIPKILKQKQIYGYKCDDYFIDIGIPEDYMKFCDIVEGGKFQ